MENTNNPDHKGIKTDLVEVGKEHTIAEMVEYVENAVMSRTIIKKSTGNVTAVSFSEGEELCEKTIPYDNYIQIIDGEAELKVFNKTHFLKKGAGFVIPAHALQCFYATKRFKMISTIIKSGYEE